MSKRLDAWKNRTQVITLSSGFDVEVKMLDVMAMASSNNGNAPNPLMRMVQDAKQGEGQVDLSKLDGDSLTELMSLVRKVCIKAIVDPPLTENGHEDGISIDEIPFGEKMEIFGELMGGGEAISQAKTFLGAEGAGLAVTPDIQPIQDDASGGDGD